MKIKLVLINLYQQLQEGNLISIICKNQTQVKDFKNIIILMMKIKEQPHHLMIKKTHW